jgi:hypothetical protein
VKFQSALSEAWRNLLSGTSRAPVLIGVFVALVGVLLIADVRAVIGVQQAAAVFRGAGGSVSILETSNKGVDAARCEALAGTTGIHSAGAVRTSDSTRALRLPSTDLAVWEVTPGLLEQLLQTSSARGNTGAGIWLSTDLATVLAAAPGDTIETVQGPTPVAGVFDWPDDGRRRIFGYSALSPVPAVGEFEQCWAEVWPVDQDTAALLYTTTDATRGDEALGQLNSSFGISFDGVAMLDDRVTKWAPLVSAVVAIGLAAAAIRVRRLELAAALHARVPRTLLAIQHIAEAAVWLSAGALILTAINLALSATAGVGGTAETLVFGEYTIASALGGGLLGTISAVAATREKHMFRYFKDR